MVGDYANTNCTKLVLFLVKSKNEAVKMKEQPKIKTSDNFCPMFLCCIALQGIRCKLPARIARRTLPSFSIV